VELPRLAPRPDVIVTSLPDLAELDIDPALYPAWFARAAAACLDAVPPAGVAVFYQTDRRRGGALLSKAALLLELDRRVLFHKIVLRRPAGSVDLYRPAFSHLIAFSERGRPGPATPDVIDAGRVLWPNGIGLTVCSWVVRWTHRFGDVLADPFCGYGTVLAAAEADGYASVIGIDIDAACCELA